MTRFALALLAVAVPLAAQNTSLQGVVSDTQAAAIPEAVITITNTSTTASRKTVTGETGSFLFAQVPPGPYKVTIEKSGFRTHSADLVLQTNTPATLNVSLELGQVNETVNVTAEAALVNTENA